MEKTQSSYNNHETGSLGSVVSEVVTSLKDVIRSEIHLAKAEIKESGKLMGASATQIAIFGTIAFLGIFPLMAFLVIGLGRIMNDNYWLSSLLVGLVFVGVGGLMAYKAVQKMKTYKVDLPLTRQTLQQDVQVVDEKFHEISDVTKRRSA